MSTKFNPAKEVRAFPAAEVRVQKDAEGRPSKIVGYAAMFNTRSQPLRAGKTQFREVINKGAFADVLAAGQDVRALFNHNPDRVLGRTTNGSLSLAEDDRGLRFEVDVNPDDPEAMSVAAKIERGDVDGCSFGFRTEKDSWTRDGEENIRTIEKCSALLDVGPVTYPAYLDTVVDVRSMVEAGVAGAAEGETRAITTVEYDDPSIVYACRCLIDYSRATFDRLQRVVDCVGAVQGELTPADMEAANDAVSSLVDLLAKTKRCKAALENLGAEDETEQEADRETVPATAADVPPEAEANSATPAGEDRLAHLMNLQRMAEAGMSTLDQVREALGQK